MAVNVEWGDHRNGSARGRCRWRSASPPRGPRPLSPRYGMYKRILHPGGCARPNAVCAAPHAASARAACQRLSAGPAWPEVPRLRARMRSCVRSGATPGKPSIRRAAPSRNVLKCVDYHFRVCGLLSHVRQCDCAEQARAALPPELERHCGAPFAGCPEWRSVRPRERQCRGECGHGARR